MILYKEYYSIKNTTLLKNNTIKNNTLCYLPQNYKIVKMKTYKVKILYIIKIERLIK